MTHGANLTIQVPLPDSTDLLAGTSTTGTILFDNQQNLTHAVTTIVRTRVTTATASQQVLDTAVDSRTIVRTPAHLLVYVRPPPTTVYVREPFNVTLALTTELGLPVPAEAVQAVLLAGHNEAQPVRKANGATPAKTPSASRSDSGESDSQVHARHAQLQLLVTLRAAKLM